MSLTPNFGMNIPDASDIVNLLTQCYPNFTLLDTALQTIKETGVSTATESKSGTVHIIQRTVSDCAVFWFTATSNFATGDTFTVDGSPVTAVKVSGAGLETGDFVINSNVPCIVKGGVLTVLAGGAGTPDASQVSYDNTLSGLTATDVQDAIDELKADIPAGFPATAISYDNTSSGLTATDVQNAIDEVAGKKYALVNTIPMTNANTVYTTGDLSAYDGKEVVFEFTVGGSLGTGCTITLMAPVFDHTKSYFSGDMIDTNAMTRFKYSAPDAGVIVFAQNTAVAPITCKIYAK